MKPVGEPDNALTNEVLRRNEESVRHWKVTVIVVQLGYVR